MNFSSLLNHEEDPIRHNPLDDQHDALLSSTRMSFEYLNAQHNMSPAAIGSPAFFSTPTEFAGDSDNDGMTTFSMNQLTSMNNDFTTPFSDPGIPLGVPTQSYDPVRPPSTFEQDTSYSAFPSEPSSSTHQDSSYNPFAFSAGFPYGQDPDQFSASLTGPIGIIDDTAEEKGKKAAKTKSKVKQKVKTEPGTNSDGSSSGGPSKPSSRATKMKGSAKAKRNTLLASSNQSSPAPSPGPSALANELHFESPDPDPEEGFDRESLSKPIPHAKESEELKPLTTDHLKVAQDPDSSARLPTPFRHYVPPRIGPNGVVISDSEDEDEELAKKRAQARRSATLAAKGKSRARIEEEAREEADDRLYCICRQPYEPERMMIACDRCEEWYHIECVKIPADSVELVDQFFCPPCQKKYSMGTTWHSACARPTCRKPAVTLSKYCSDFCGISVVSARLELLKLANGTDPNTFWGRVEGSRRKEAKVIDETGSIAAQKLSTSFQAVEDARTLSRLEAKLQETNSRREGLSAVISRVEKRLLYLKIVIRRWERLCQATADELTNAGIGQPVEDGGEAEAKPAANKKGKRKSKAGKKKKPLAATSLPEAQCGLDVRLVYDDEAWREWIDLDVIDAMDENGESRQEPGGKNILQAQEQGDESAVLDMAMEMLSGVCLETRKRCERHTGWQKLREADFQVEKAVLHRRLDRLDSLSQSLEAQISLHQQATAFRVSNENRSVSPSRLISVDAFMKDQEARQPRAKTAVGGSTRNSRHSSSPLVNGSATSTADTQTQRADSVAQADDAIPPELLPFLSRGEIAKLKAQRR